MAHTKSYLAFKNKMLHFDDDLDFVDIIRSAVTATSIPEGSQSLFEFQDTEKHMSLSRYSLCQDNRLIVVQHLKATIFSSYIKDIYEELTMYLRNVTAEAYLNATVLPERIIGEHKVTMSAVDVLSRLQDGTLAQVVIDNVFQVLENERSTISLIKKTCSKLGLSIDDKIVDDAVYYLEIRHKLVHTDGLADDEFRSKHPTLKYTNRNYIDLTYSTISCAKTAICKLIDAIDADALTKRVVFPA